MRCLVFVVPRRARLRWLGLVAAVLTIAATVAEAMGVLVRGVRSGAWRRRVGWPRRGRASRVLVAVALGGLCLASPAAADSQCPAKTPTNLGPCGPTFTLPAWGDAGGWKSPDQYSTIQFGRVLGNGRDQLIGRSAAGIAVWDFDTGLGQWRPALGPQNKPTLLTDFADPPMLTVDQPTFGGTDWTRFVNYTTIQVADVLGTGREQIIARSNSGITVWSYTPGPAGAPGQWSQVAKGGPFSEFTVPIGDVGDAASATIQTADLDGDGKAEIFAATLSSEVKAYKWNGSSFTQLPAIPWNIPPLSAQAATLQSSPMIDGRQELWYADGDGMHGLRLNAAGTGWTRLSTVPPRAPFGPVCDLGETTPTPWGSSPAYYETCRVVNVTGSSNRQFVMRGVDGLELFELTSEGLKQLATLNAFSDPNGWNQQKYWQTIQYADVDGSPDGRQEVVARGPNGVVVYEYGPGADQWIQWPTQISLTDDPWGSDPSYFSTLRLGDASGTGRQDTLIARGPYGIRTWFYTPGSQGGWSAYSASGYPDFEGAQQNAYTAANGLQAIEAILQPAGVTKIRDYWMTANAPTSDSLGGLQTTLAAAAGCSGQQTFAPPKYQSCTPPSGATGFDAGDWLTVVNQLLSEAWAAQQVVAFYAQLEDIRQTVFTLEGPELDAIAGNLHLTAATDTPTSWSMTGVMAGLMGVAAAVTYLQPELSAFLWVAAEITSMFPSASPSLANNDFDGTYNQLKNVFATGAADTWAAIRSQSLQVRSDLNLLSLVAQLRQAGTWGVDEIGMESSSNQAFALWVYKTLGPVMYRRYSVVNCTSDDYSQCNGPTRAEPGVLGAVPNFTIIGNPPTAGGVNAGTPCYTFNNGDFEGQMCDYEPLDSLIANAIWDPLPENCAYDPSAQNPPNTVWRFGSCPLGVDPETSINVLWDSPKSWWDWTSLAGSPYVDAESAVVGAAAASAGSASSSSLGRAASVSLRGVVKPVRPVHISRTKVALNRVLFDPRGAGELVRHAAAPTSARAVARSSQRPRQLAPTTLRHTGGGTFTGPRSAPRGHRRPSIQLKLTKRQRRSLAFRLRISNVAIPVPPAACVHAHRRIATTRTSFPLTMKFTLREPKRKPQAIRLRPRFTCRLDSTGATRALIVVKPRRPKLGRGLSVRISHPRHLTVGRRGTLTATVRNRTHRTAHDVFIRAFVPPGLRVVSHSRGATVTRHGRPVPDRVVVRRLAKLRKGKSRTIRLGLVPTTSGRRCTTVAAHAMLRKESARRACISVKGARPPAPERACPGTREAPAGASEWRRAPRPLLALESHASSDYRHAGRGCVMAGR
jgi:hypothetical protein